MQSLCESAAMRRSLRCDCFVFRIEAPVLMGDVGATAVPAVGLSRNEFVDSVCIYFE